MCIGVHEHEFIGVCANVCVFVFVCIFGVSVRVSWHMSATNISRRVRPKSKPETLAIQAILQFAMQASGTSENMFTKHN